MNKNKKRIRQRILIIVLIFTISSYIFSNWEDFKSGLTGKPYTSKQSKD